MFGLKFRNHQQWASMIFLKFAKHKNWHLSTFCNKFGPKFAFTGDFYSPGKTLKSFPRVSREQQQYSSKTKKLFPDSFFKWKSDICTILFMCKVCRTNWMWKLCFCCSHFWFFLPLLITVIHRHWIAKCCISKHTFACNAATI